MRGQRTCILLKAAAEKGESFLTSIRAKYDSASSPEEGMKLMRPQELNAQASQAFYSQNAAHEYGALATRMLLFQTLSNDERKGLVSSGKVAFARRSIEAVPGTELTARPFYELHTGYVFGGSRAVRAARRLGRWQ